MQAFVVKQLKVRQAQLSWMDLDLTSSTWRCVSEAVVDHALKFAKLCSERSRSWYLDLEVPIFLEKYKKTGLLCLEECVPSQ